jgi:hypothetical protein
VFACDAFFWATFASDALAGIIGPVAAVAADAGAVAFELRETFN